MDDQGYAATPESLHAGRGAVSISMASAVSHNERLVERVSQLLEDKLS